MNRNKKLSIIVPCYNEQETVKCFYDEIIKVTNQISGYDFEFIYVNDGSKDQTVPFIKQLREQDDRVCLIDFSRNFGKEAAMLAGMEHSSGEVVVIMDVDLQDPPQLLPQMIKLYEDGYENVYTRRRNRNGEPPIRSFFANMFYRIINRMSDIEIIDGARDYRLLSRRAVDDLVSLKEANRFSKGLFQWVGYQSICLEFDHVERVAGETKWNFMKLADYAIEGITAFSNAPLRFATYTGMFIASLSFLYLLYIFFDTMINGNSTAGWPSIVCIMLFLGGIQLIFLGVIGEYIGRIYNEVKQRPIYIIKELVK
ncbi:Bactoprenol glucosyl transferase homolog from prophage CPS-53 [Turicibacter sanguinis]|nr:Bactoprenol glucosyl transferase homolog from prophage CPS-53 [Turicibacter sanguinis]